MSGVSSIKVKCPGCGFVWDMLFDKKVKRSSPQNRYFHGVILPVLSDHLGYTTDEIKDLVKSMFLKDEMFVNTKNGVKEVFIVRGSSELKTDEFERFTEDIRRWAITELDCYIPEPNEVLKEQGE